MTQPPPHILCVDDEADILDVAQIALETIGGYKVSVCHSGKEALEKIAAIKPDLILLDVMMPGLDGPATYQKLHQSRDAAHLPVIFMTAKVQPGEISVYTGMGALGVITKPFDPMKLAGQVQAHWENFQKKSP